MGRVGQQRCELSRLGWLSYAEVSNGGAVSLQAGSAHREFAASV